MLRFNRLAAVVLVGVLVTVAFGKAIKIKAISPYEGTQEALNGADGMAIFNYHPGGNQTEATVAITDFVPGEIYGTWIIPGGMVNLAEIANPAGNATFHGFFDFDLCKWNENGITVYIFRDLDGDLMPNMDGSEFVAEGWSDCPAP